MDNYAEITKKIKGSALPLALVFLFFGVISWKIIEPLAMPLLWSVLFSYFAHPIYRFIYFKVFGRRHRNLAAGIAALVIIIFMALPLALLSAFVTKEAVWLIQNALECDFINGEKTLVNSLADSLKTLPLVGRFIETHAGLINSAFVDAPFMENITNEIAAYLTALISKVSGHIFETVMKVLFTVMIVCITSFFLVRDGDRMVKYITDLLPFAEDEKKAFMERTSVMLRAVVCGIVMTAGIQGILGGLGWRFVGIPHPVFFGFCMFFTAMIPFVGTPSIWVPGTIYLFLHGKSTEALMLLAWGLCVVSSIDNFIKPIFISEGSKIHMLVIFIGIFGGLYLWGVAGVFIGPLALSLAMFVLDMYSRIIRK